MKVLETHIFSFEEFSECDAIVKVICGYTPENGYDSPITINDWPLFHKVTVYVGENELRIERPYNFESRGHGSTTRPSILIEVPKNYKEEVINFINKH